MSGKHHALPYETEYAKSSRASCKGCKQSILQGKLRIAVMVQSPFFDGKTPKWFHEECFWKKNRPKAFLDIHGVTTLRSADQELIKSKILGASAPSEPDAPSKGGKKQPKKRMTKAEKAIENGKVINNLNDFSIEYAKSNRSQCRGCEAKIAKESMRVSKLSFESDQAKMIGGIPEWYHLECFAAVRSHLQFEASGKLIPGFEDLKKADQKAVDSKLPAMNTGNSKTDATDGPSASKKARIALDEISSEFQAQNDEILDTLSQVKKIKKKEISYVCEINNLLIPKKLGDVHALIADHLVCGKLKACPQCKKQGMYEIVPEEGYKCKNTIDIPNVQSIKNVSCDKELKNVEREPLFIPDEYIEKFPFLAAFAGNVGKRIFPRSEIVPAPVVNKSVAPVKSEPSEGPQVCRFLPLKNMVFYIHVSAAPTAPKKQKLTSALIALGADVITTVKSHLAAAIATEHAVLVMEEGGKGSSALEDLKDFGIHVVPEKFIKAADKELRKDDKPLALIEKMNVAPWGSDISARIQETKDLKLKSQHNKSNFSKSGVVKLNVKDGLAVDPDSGLADSAELARDYSGKHLNVVLSNTDVTLGKNSYYKLQVLRSKIHKDKYYLFRSWGRIGTTIGGHKLEDFKNLDDALLSFEEIFEEKTENFWGDRFHPVPGKMRLLDVKYEKPKSEKKTHTITSAAKCEIEQPVADLVVMLFDEKTMAETLMEYELDLDRMPLGKLSATHMKDGYKILNEIISVLDNTSDDLKKNLIVNLTGVFYSHIPHSFGLSNPPLLDTKEAVIQKIDMLDAMTQIELAFTIKNEGTPDGVHPVMNCYSKLQADIKSIDTSHEHFELILNYVQNTHSKTHRQYSLHILNVFEVARKGEEKRFKPFEKLGNKQLLWHGSRLTNFASIISKGLCIAPPEAPVTGYMFGKGIYFADSVSKSANYCMTSSSNNVGLLLLCEVALGNVLTKKQAEFVTKLPSGYHSVQGLGRTMPDPSGTITIKNDIKVPTGNLIELSRDQITGLTLIHNEFIVYDPAQVKIRYILKVRFDYK